MAFAPEDRAQRTDALGALRGVLALIVCVGHGFQIFLVPTLGTNPAGHTVYFTLFLSARLAVLCFFCLSGFSIAHSIRRNAERHHGFRLEDFALARVARIAPPLLSVIALVALLAAVLGSLHLASVPPGVMAPRSVYLTDVPSQLLALATLGVGGDLTGNLNRPLWTLTIEIQFYTLAGLAARVWLRRETTPRALAGVVLASYVVLAASHILAEPHDLGFNLVAYFCFASGWAAATHNPRTLQIARPLVAASLLLALPLLVATSRVDFTQTESSPALVGFECCMAIACSALVRWLSRRAAGGAIAALGGFSYTLYVVHFPLLLLVYDLVVHRMPRYSASLGVVLALIVTVAVLGFAWQFGGLVERPAVHRAWLVQKLSVWLRRPVQPSA